VAATLAAFNRPSALPARAEDECRAASRVIGPQEEMAMASVRAAAALVLLTMPLGACQLPRFDYETAFRTRAAALHAGTSITRLRQQLGEPSRIVRAEGGCRASGGRSTWIYEYARLEEDRVWLSEGPIAYCIGADERVVTGGRRDGAVAVAGAS
jgi:hypothetical protein